MVGTVVSRGQRFTAEMPPSRGPGKEQVTVVAARFVGMQVTDAGVGGGGAGIIGVVRGQAAGTAVLHTGGYR